MHVYLAFIPARNIIQFFHGFGFRCRFLMSNLTDELKTSYHQQNCQHLCLFFEAMLISGR